MVEDLFYGAPAGSEPILFFSNYFFSLGFNKSIQDDFQHARMTDEAEFCSSGRASSCPFKEVH